MNLRILLYLLSFLAPLYFSHELLPSLCISKIFCNGRILDKIQLSNIFADDKTFVDKPTIKPENEVISEFENLGPNPSRDALLKFVSDNFGDENSFLVPAKIPEWMDEPISLFKFQDKYLRGFFKVINKEWKNLIRVQDKSSLCKGCTTTFLDINGTFIIPGAREYYLNRSQPPMLAQMVDLYYKSTGDIEFVVDVLPALKKEHRYWTDHHMVKVKSPYSEKNVVYNLFRYIVEAKGPRPEGYRHDYAIAKARGDKIKPPDGPYGIYSEIAAGAESGFDFSSRWLNDSTKDYPANLGTSITSQIIPSDLNSILYTNQKIISEFCRIAATHSKDPQERRSLMSDAVVYETLMRQTLNGIMGLMFDNSTGLFSDFNMLANKKSEVWSTSNLWMYWYISSELDPSVLEKVWTNISGILDKNEGGVPVTLKYTELQWDYPSVWPPLQYVLIKGLIESSKSIRKSNPKKAKEFDDLALRIANTMLGTSFCAWYHTGGSIPGVLEKLPGINDTGHIFEKYNSTSFGSPAGGGEYKIQSGFGWTNGVLLWIINMFGDSLDTPKCVLEL
ncbi:hypothetical protein BB560_007050 [Smittium megazygosporum]|uniref:Trehalase n=1 Tax=Smittium megazygosporum TaxID=133381 RepID=A0A2T9XZ36_9FUNG|nr:hypothetical protein BB560_007050 [Smittium megazygosporum]